MVEQAVERVVFLQINSQRLELEPAAQIHDFQYHCGAA